MPYRLRTVLKHGGSVVIYSIFDAFSERYTRPTRMTLLKGLIHKLAFPIQKRIIMRTSNPSLNRSLSVHLSLALKRRSGAHLLQTLIRGLPLSLISTRRMQLQFSKSLSQSSKFKKPSSWLSFCTSQNSVTMLMDTKILFSPPGSVVFDIYDCKMTTTFGWSGSRMWL